MSKRPTNEMTDAVLAGPIKEADDDDNNDHEGSRRFADKDNPGFRAHQLSELFLDPT